MSSKGFKSGGADVIGSSQREIIDSLLRMGINRKKAELVS